MEEKKINQKIAEGYLNIRCIVEVIGKPKEHVEKIIKSHVEEIKKNQSYLITKESFEEAVEQDEYFSAFVELELLIKNSKELLSFCFDYMPSSVEILEPEKIRVKGNIFSDFLNDLQARLHAVNTGVIELKEKNRFYVKNTAVLLRNFIVVLLSSRPMKVEEMQPFLGVKREDIQKVLNVLEKEGKIKKEENKYSVVKK